jgi:hypothetical protein
MTFFPLASECSQIRMTTTPERFNLRELAMSRCLFRIIFVFQNARRVFGTCPQRGHPCQKQPSTKTASFLCLKKKSGLPGRSIAWRRQPEIFERTNAIRRASSVDLLFFPRIAAIVRDRTSGTLRNLPAGNFSLRFLSKVSRNLSRGFQNPPAGSSRIGIFSQTRRMQHCLWSVL